MSENENSLFISQRSAILPIPFVQKPQKLKTKIRNYFGYNHLYFLEEIQLREFDCLDNEFTRPNRGELLPYNLYSMERSDREFRGTRQRLIPRSCQCSERQRWKRPRHGYGYWRGSPTRGTLFHRSAVYNWRPSSPEWPPPERFDPQTSIPKYTPGFHGHRGGDSNLCTAVDSRRFIITANSIEAFVPLRPTRLHVSRTVRD